MQNIVTPDIISVLVGGGIITLLVGLVKPKLEKYNTQVIVLVFAFLAAIGYQAFNMYVPTDTQQAVLNFIYAVASSSVLIYEFVWKNFQNWRQNKSNTTPTAQT